MIRTILKRDYKKKYPYEKNKLKILKKTSKHIGLKFKNFKALKYVKGSLVLN